MLYRLILAEWAKAKNIGPTVIEKFLTDSELQSLNLKGYNCYTILNSSSTFTPGEKDDTGKPVYLEGSHIDTFQFVFVDMDLKDGVFKSKAEFIEFIRKSPLKPTAIVDSGNGIHVYWRVEDLTAESFVRLQRRLCRDFKTDPTVCTIYRLMRVPSTYNVKLEGDFKLCEVIENSDSVYSCETLDKALSPITIEDEEYAKTHINQTYNVDANLKIAADVPKSFIKFMVTRPEVKQLFYGPVKDRSKADYRLAHLLVVNGFKRDEILSIMLNTDKALERAPIHQYNYAKNIVDKVAIHEADGQWMLQSVSSLLDSIDDNKTSARIYCHPMVDATQNGFRLTQVMGLVGGSGIGKTALSLNCFRWFAQYNPEYVHVFISLEQPGIEIAERWKKLCKNNPNRLLDNKIHIIGNRKPDGTVKRFTFMELEEEIINFEKNSGKKVGCIVIDHIGVIKKRNAEGQRVELEDMCELMKSFAINTNTFLIMLSQTSRAKAGWGDIELDKDAAFGTTFFEANCDYLVTTWQPLKRIYDRAGHLTCNALKFCKIRHKTVGKDHIQEDQIYAMHFNPDSEEFTELTGDQLKAFNFYQSQATQVRNKDKKREPSPVKAMTWLEDPNGKAHNYTHQI